MSGRTMIGGRIEEPRLDPGVYRDPISFKDVTGRDPEPGEIIEYQGEQYARLPEGWPAAEAKELEEAHTEAVMADEPADTMTEWERDLYSWTPEEVKELAHAYIANEMELIALRKGMKTMQRKTRKQAQRQRRLERRLAQARARRDQLIANEETAQFVRSYAEMKAGRGVVVRGIEPQASSMIDFDALAKEPRGFA